MSKTNLEKIKNSKNIWRVVKSHSNNGFDNYYRYNHELDLYEHSYDNKVWYRSGISDVASTLCDDFNNNCVVLEEVIAEMTNLEKIKNSKNVWRVVKQPTGADFNNYYRYNHKLERYECSYDNDFESWVKSSLEVCTSSIEEHFNNSIIEERFNNSIIEEIVPNVVIMTNLEKVKNSKNVWEVISSSFGLSKFYRYNQTIYSYEYSSDLKVWLLSIIGCCTQQGDVFNNAIIKELIPEKESEKVENNLSPLEQLVMNSNTDYVLLDKNSNIVSVYKWSHGDLYIKQNVYYSRFTNITQFIVNVNSTLQNGGKFCKLSECHNRQISQVLNKFNDVQSPRGVTFVAQADYNTKHYVFDVKPTQNIDLNGSFKNVNQTLLNEKLTIQEIDREIELLQYVKELKKVIEENK